MKNKIISIILSTMLTVLATPNLCAKAIDMSPTNCTIESDETRAAGLISSCAIGCTGGSKTIYLTAEVFGTDIMAKIGFKNIKIQRSSNQVSWTTEKTIPDKISEEAAFKVISTYPISVSGGYYYRIVLDNYAKENTWWFPETQTVQSISETVWIS